MTPFAALSRVPVIGGGGLPAPQSLSDFAARGQAVAIPALVDAGWCRYDSVKGREFLPAATNKVRDPQVRGALDGTYWSTVPADLTVTPNVDVPDPLPDTAASVAKCAQVAFVNAGTARSWESEKLTAGANTKYWVGVHTLLTLSAGAQVLIEAVFYNSGVQARTVAVATVSASDSGFLRRTAKATSAASGENQIAIRYTFSGGNVSGYLSGHDVLGAPYLSPYFDGTTTAGGAGVCAWSGTAHQSASTRALSQLSLPWANSNTEGTVALKLTPIFPNGEVDTPGYGFLGGNSSQTYLWGGNGTGGLAAFGSSAAPSQVGWAAGSVHRVIGRYGAATFDTRKDGVNSTQTARSAVWVTTGAQFDFFTYGNSNWLKGGFWAKGMVISTERKSDAWCSTLDASAANFDDEVFLFNQVADGDVIWPLTKDASAFVKNPLGGRPYFSGTLAFVGDSQTVQETTGGANWPTRIISNLLPTYRFYHFNDGLSGVQWTYPASRGATVVDPYLNKAGGGKNILCVYMGTNDLNSTDTAQQAYDECVAYCNARRVAGWKVIIATLPSFINAKRSDYNALIRANWATFADALADLAADSRIGDDGDYSDRQYFQADNIHLTYTTATGDLKSGHYVVAEVFQAAILTLI